MYIITTTTCGARSVTTKRTSKQDVANYFFQQAVYSAIEALAGLDTSWGHEAIRKAHNWESGCLDIRVGGKTGYLVQIMRRDAQTMQVAA